LVGGREARERRGPERGLSAWRKLGEVREGVAGRNESVGEESA